MTSPSDPKWLVVANVKRETEHGTAGAEKQLGLKHFSPGTKVYIGVLMHDKAKVLGRHRGGARLVSLVVSLRHLENYRVKLVYEPRVLSEWTMPDLGEAGAAEYLQRAVNGSKWGEAPGVVDSDP